MKKRWRMLCVVVIVTSVAAAQIKPKNNWLEQELRINLLFAPSLEYELPIYGNFAIATRVGVVYGPSWGKKWSHVSSFATRREGEFFYGVFPFAQMDFKYMYNRDRRTRLGHKLPYNAGDFVGIRAVYYSKSILSNYDDLLPITAYGAYPIWGMQRAFGRVHFAFDVGIPYCMDMYGNKHFCVKVNINIGLNIKSWVSRPRRYNMEPEHDPDKPTKEE